MVWRGIAARRLISLAIFLLTVLVVAGTLISVSLSRITGVSRGSAVALVLLGFVALAGQSIESVRRRQPEVALARLRGRHGARLLLFTVAEPCVVVVLGAVAGVIAGRIATSMIVGAWLPTSATPGLGRGEWTAIGLVTLASLLLVVAVSSRVTRAPLIDQLVAARRPPRASTLVLFLQLVLVLGAVVSIYQAHGASGSRIDWVTLVSPALVGLAGGQLLIWTLLGLLAVVVARNQTGQLGWFLTVRRLLRRADSLSVIRIVVAAGVVIGVATSAAHAGQTWRDDRARLQVGGPVSYPVEDGALRAYAAARAADPQRRWLLPIAAYTSFTDAPDRRVFVAFDRWRPVVGDFFSSTPAAAITSQLDRIHPATPVQVVVGSTTTATVDTSSLRNAKRVRLTFQYVDDRGDTALATLPFRSGDGAPAGHGLTRFTGRVARCQHACAVSEVDISGRTSTAGGAQTPLNLRDVTFAGERVVGGTSSADVVSDQPGLGLVRDGSAVQVTMTPSRASGVWTLSRLHRPTGQPVLSAGVDTATLPGRHPVLQGVDGIPLEVSVVATVPAMPFVGTVGRMADLGTMLAGSGGSVPDTRALVVARADTPPGVIAALRATHAVGRPTTYAHEAQRLDRTSRAEGTTFYVVIAVIAALIALVSIVAALLQQRGERRREAASLRSVGIRAGTVAGAYRREAWLLAAATFVGTAIAGWIACRALLPALPLVSGWEFAPALDAMPPLALLTTIALAAGVVTGLMTLLAFRTVGRGARPGMLREDPS